MLELYLGAFLLAIGITIWFNSRASCADNPKDANTQRNRLKTFFGVPLGLGTVVILYGIHLLMRRRVVDVEPGMEM